MAYLKKAKNRHHQEKRTDEKATTTPKKKRAVQKAQAPLTDQPAPALGE